MSALILFLERTFPSANMVYIRGQKSVLFDTGFGSDFPTTEKLLLEIGMPALIINSHYHCDHTGGNHRLQTKYGLAIAAHRWEGQVVNNRDPEAGAAVWLNQPMEPYTVTQFLSDGDVIDTGAVALHVIHTPGHTAGHISLFEPESRFLIAGDALHSDDVAWLGIYREGIGSIYRMLETLDKLAALAPLKMCSGHSPITDDPMKAIDSARRRYEKWVSEPQKIGWHACKRIFSYALILSDGMNAAEMRGYLLGSPWFLDYSRYTFHSDPEKFIQPLLEEMIRSGAAVWRDGKLYPNVPYNPPTRQDAENPA